MLDALQQADTQCFLWVNGHHSTTLDWVMWTLSQHWCFAAVLLVVFAAVTLRREPRRWWLVAAAVGLCFLLADQGSVHLFKETVCRLRPCHALEDVRMFHTRCGGRYGFVSSHAANVFAVVTFLVWRYRKSAWTVITLVLWAMATCYSRVYLGKHYPGDIAGGMLFGIAVGLIVVLVCRFAEKKLQSHETKKQMSR